MNRTDHRRARRSRLRCVLALWGALALVVAGCVGGSGSSGFDITESLAINQAIDQQRCVEFDGLPYCPADAPSQPIGETPTTTATPGPSLTPTAMLTAAPGQPTETPTPTSFPTDTESATPSPTPTMASMRIDTSFADASSIDCSVNAATRTCSTVFAFAPQGFALGTAYRVALRRDEPDGPWEVQPTPVPAGAPGLPMFDTIVAFEIPLSPIDSPQLPQLGEVRFAVLVFLDGTGDLPATVSRLADTGADFAFVTPVVRIEPTN